MLDTLFKWVGVNQFGQKITGEIKAASKNDVTLYLHQQRIRPLTIHKKIKIPSWIWRHKKVKNKDIARFTKQLAVLLQAGIALLQAFEILQKSEPGNSLKKLLAVIQKDVESGISLNNALRQHSAFSNLYCDMVLAGEIAGMLDIVLERLATHLEKTERLKQTLKTALIYPTVVLSVAVLVFTLILTFVIPAFKEIYASFGGELPWLTQILLNLSSFWNTYAISIVTTIICMVWSIQYMLKNKLSFRKRIHALLLNTPLAGGIIKNACIARWSRTLATLFSAGVPLTEGLIAIQGVTGNLLFTSATQSTYQFLLNGKSLSQALEYSETLFPPMVVQLCLIGEESGTLDHMLHKIAEHYEREVDTSVTALSTLMEPLLMIILGLLVGLLVLALYLPIFQLGQVI